MPGVRTKSFVVRSLVCAALGVHAFGADVSSYSIVARMPGGSGGAWDYALVDPTSRTLFLAQGGITSLDLKTHVVRTGLVRANTSHGVAILGDGRLAVDDSKTKEIVIFNPAGEILASIPTAQDNPVNGIHALDALVMEPHSGLLVAVNGESGLLLLVDVTQSRVVGTIKVGGRPEFAAADGMGSIYLNVNHGKHSEIVGVDISARRITEHYGLPDCEDATGLALDVPRRILMSVCANGRFEVINMDGGRAVTIEVGAGADAIMWDFQRRVAFVASADDGALSVIRIGGPTDVALIQVLKTQKGTRLGAVDVDTGVLYLPTAKFGPPTPPNPYPSVVPGSFEFLMIAPR